MTISDISGAGLGLDFLSYRIDGVIDSSLNSSSPCEQELNLGTSAVQTTSASSLSDLGPRDPFDCSSSPGAPVKGSQSITRHGTLLSANAPFGRNAAELSSILGDSTSRLKPGAIILPLPGQHDQERTRLEQAKSRPRVKVDIILNSYTYVQGGYLQGYVKIKVFECARNEVPVMISGGKVRVIGYESISNKLDKYPFYRCSSPLETVTGFSSEYHDSFRDSEGFAQAIEGEHMLPFSMHLPMSADYGVPKGSIQAEVAVRYIAMVSINIKDPISSSRSIAHFYRSCEIWPRFNPSIILEPAERPYQAEIDSDPCLSGSHRINLTASVHRLHWVAGQQCFVKVYVTNESKRTVKSISLSLIRNTTVFKPSHGTNTFDGHHDGKPDACSVSTTQKLVTESVLEMGRRIAPRHASARGWWVGVAPGECLEFSHSVLLPPDALSVICSRLLQVDYSIRVTLTAGGTLRPTQLQVSLPIHIINFISIDHPPSLLPRDSTQNQISNTPTSATLPKRLLRTGETRIRPMNMLPSAKCETRPRGIHENKTYSAPHNADLAPQHTFDSLRYDSDDDSTEVAQRDMDLDPPEDLQCFIDEDDADEIFPRILQDDPKFENAPRFADLYYASVQDLRLSSVSHQADGQINYSSTCASQYQANMERKAGGYALLRSGLHHNSISPTRWKSDLSKGPPSFASRVQAKIAAAAEASSGHVDPGCAFNPMMPSSLNVTDTSPCRDSMIARTLGNPHYPHHTHGRVSDTTGSSGQLACGDRHTVLAALSTFNSTNSLSRSRDSTSNGGQSVKLKCPSKLPAIVDIDSAGYPMDEQASTEYTTHDSALNDTQPSTLLVRPETDKMPINLSQHQEQVTELPEEPEIDDGRLGLSHTLEAYKGVLPRPSILIAKEQQVGATSSESTKSVKDRIRELEERQKVLQLNEASGVRSFV